MEFSVSRRDFALKFLSVAFTTALVAIAGCDRPPRAPKHSHNLLQHRLRSKVQSLDPADIGDTVSHTVASEIFECLYEYHYLNTSE